MRHSQQARYPVGSQLLTVVTLNSLRLPLAKR